MIKVSNGHSLSQVANRWANNAQHLDRIILESSLQVAEEVVTALKERMSRERLMGQGVPWSADLVDHIQAWVQDGNVWIGIPPWVEGASDDEKRVTLTALALEKEYGAVENGRVHPPRPILRNTVRELRPKETKRLEALIARRLERSSL